MRVVALALMLAFGMTADAAEAQDVATQLPDVTVQKAMRLALRQIQRVPCGEANCAATTDEEMETPPLPVELARRIIAAGTLAGPANWCGEDWQQRLFGPMMAALSKPGGPGPRGVALGSLLFGIYQGQSAGPLAAAGPCPPEVKAAVAIQLSALSDW